MKRTNGGDHLAGRRGRKHSATLRPEHELNPDQLAFRRAWITRWQRNTLAMARDLGFGESTIRQYVHGTRTPKNPKYMRRLAEVQGVTVEGLRIPEGIVVNHRIIRPDHPLYDRLLAAMLAVDPTLGEP